MDYFNNWRTGPETHKDWIGLIDRKNLKFKMEEPTTFLKRKITIEAKGKIELRASTTHIKVRLGLEITSFLWIFLMYTASVFLIYGAFTREESNYYIPMGLFFAAYPILGTILINRRMKRCERKLDELFG